MKRKLFLFSVIMSVLLLAGCGGDSIDTVEKVPDSIEDSSNSISTKKDTVIVAYESDASTLLANFALDSITTTQIQNIYEHLIDRDPKTGALIPNLAEGWESIDDLTWEFKLKENVKFHNGNEFDAEAVKFSIDFILDEKNSSAHRPRWSNVKEVNVISPNKVEIITNSPYSELLEDIATDLLIMEPKYIQEVGVEEASKKPIGTGPYKFKEWVRDNYLKLEAFEDYWKGTPSIKNVEYKYIPELSTRISALLSEEVDLVKGLPIDSIKKIKETDGVKIMESNTVRFTYLALNALNPGPMQEKDVRKAINHAIDVDELLDNILDGYGKKMTGPLPEITKGYVKTKEYEYNPEEAIKILNEAGFDAKDLKLKLDTPNGRYPMDSYIAQGIAFQLSEIGIDVEVEVNEWGNHIEKIKSRKSGDMYILGWGTFDAGRTISALFTEDQVYSSFHDDDIAKKIKKAGQTFDEIERNKAWGEIQHDLVEAAVWVPLWQEIDIYAVNSDLNFLPNVTGSINLYEMSWD